jgi:RNA polymerase sigma factor (sigma-70 family)
MPGGAAATPSAPPKQLSRSKRRNWHETGSWSKITSNIEGWLSLPISKLRLPACARATRRGWILRCRRFTPSFTASRKPAWPWSGPIIPCSRPPWFTKPTYVCSASTIRIGRAGTRSWAWPHALRRILVNYAEARKAEKRGGGFRIPIDDQLELMERGQLEIQLLDLALNRLEEIDARQARIVELRFFCGLSVEETAAALDISSATVKREWRTARLWLVRELAGERP